MVLEAGLWGLVAAASLLLGAVIAIATDVSSRVQGIVLAFGAGVLVGAVAYELVEEAVRASATGIDVGLGFGAGAVTFYLGSVALDRMSPATERGAVRLGARRNARAAGLAIVLGAVLDGIPESVVLGLSLLEGSGVGIPVLVAILLSNVPEAVGATEDLVAGGMSKGRVLGLWSIVVLASGLAAALGMALLGGAPTAIVVAVQAFAAGAILAMLAESMIPEAYEKGGRPVGLATALGFALATLLSFST
jgi:ZIP family zinc transporter